MTFLQELRQNVSAWSCEAHSTVIVLPVVAAGEICSWWQIQRVMSVGWYMQLCAGWFFGVFQSQAERWETLTLNHEPRELFGETLSLDCAVIIRQRVSGSLCLRADWTEQKSIFIPACLLSDSQSVKCFTKNTDATHLSGITLTEPIVKSQSGLWWWLTG